MKIEYKTNSLSSQPLALAWSAAESFLSVFINANLSQIAVDQWISGKIFCFFDQ
jgi:hypothetical protein